MKIDFYSAAESPPCHSVQMLIAALGLDVNVIDGKAFLRADLRPQFLKVHFTAPGVVPI